MVTAPWYQTAVFYEALVRSFKDSNADGLGDLRGIIDRLDYLVWLGVDCLWLPPVFDSPLRDGGYDIGDYYTVHADVGTIEDFADLIAAAHAKGMRVISDLVMNHTSDQHPWFQEARRPGSDRRDWYVWSDDPTRYAGARVIFFDYEESNWTWDEQAGAYYWHRFFGHQPDLNYDNPAVHDAMLDVIRFWLDMGLDGFRADAIPYLYEREGTNSENLPETHAFLKKVRAMVDAEYGDKVMLAEANQWPRDAAAYFGDGDECHMNFHFPVMPRLYMGLARGHCRDLKQILADTPAIPEGCQWGVFLRNHDELTLEMVTPQEREFMWGFYSPDLRMRKNEGIRRRLAPLVDGDRRRIELLHGLLLSLPGSPVMYYGDEIGMGDEYLLHDRDGVRTPMQWESGPGAGFSSAPPDRFYLPIVTDPAHSPAAVNVASQRDDPRSLLHWVKNLLVVRRLHPEMGVGTFEVLDPGNDAVFAFLRSAPGATTLVLANFTAADQTGTLDGVRSGAASWVDLVTGEAVTADTVGTLRPYQFRWIGLG
ncbi:MAG: maltose alpha-D-glucosyltransferase [Actinobacteria bacterium]|nr:maltose alpha-D-glucosyltransferase [Actinomycetota bacterium]